MGQGDEQGGPGRSPGDALGLTALMRILVVDDERGILDQLGGILTDQKYTVETAADGEKAIERILVQPFDLVILDIMLPRMDGFSVLKEMRREKIETPVLMLTARGQIEDRVKGLDLGADDYLAKPFSSAELLARARALLRRRTTHGSSVLEAGGIRLDTSTREVTADGSPVKLTPKEFAILEFLLYNRNRAVSRFSLAEHVWGDDFDPFTMSNYIDVHVKNVRRKTGDAGGNVIRTIRGVGYMITDPAT